MAHPRGQATIEAAGTLAVFTAFTIGILAQSYLLWARVWLGYAAEQSLYCLAESKPVATCERKFRTQIRRALPIGHLTQLNFYPRESQWNLNFEWRCKGHKLQSHRTLTMNDLKRGTLKVSR